MMLTSVLVVVEKELSLKEALTNRTWAVESLEEFSNFKSLVKIN